MYNSNETRSIANERERQMQARNKDIFVRNQTIIDDADKAHQIFKNSLKAFENSKSEQQSFMIGAKEKRD